MTEQEVESKEQNAMSCINLRDFKQENRPVQQGVQFERQHGQTQHGDEEDDVDDLLNTCGATSFSGSGTLLVCRKLVCLYSPT